MKKMLSFITALTIGAVAALPAFAEKGPAAGDVNGDGVVNVTDISLIAAQVKSVKALPEDMSSRADINGDGRVNVSDITMLAVHVKGGKSEIWDTYSKLSAFIEENDLDASAGFSPHYLTGRTAVNITIDGTAFEDETSVPKETLEKHGMYAYEKIVRFMEESGIDQNKVQIDMLE
jgi:hypothetical protein